MRVLIHAFCGLITALAVAFSHGQVPLESGSFVSAEISVLGEVDSYSFEASPGESIYIRVVDLSLMQFDPFIPLLRVTSPSGLTVFDNDGDPVVWWDCQAGTNCPLPESGVYEVQVSASSDAGTGNYEIHFGRAPADTDMNEIPNGDRVTGQLTYGDIDLWTFQALAGESAEIRLTRAGGVAPEINVFDPTGRKMNDGFANPVAPVYCSTGRFCELSTSGTYTVMVTTSFSFGEGDYAIELAKVPGVRPDGALTPGGFAIGEIELGDIDAYTFEASPGDDVVIRAYNTQSTSFFPELALYAPDGTELQNDPGQVSCVAASGCVLPEPGTYTVLVKDFQWNSPGRYLIEYNAESPFCSVSSDSDGDSIMDNCDNCSTSANLNQTDADNDGFGNACDADYNNDCIVNIIDLGILRTAFFSADPVVDLNEDGVVNVLDLGLLRSLFFSEPGPSGVVGNCNP